ncbi:MAG TPA: site-specific integrase [Terriglobales bacterium]|jgi:integrase
MLRVYVRHYLPCESTDGNYRKCRCPKWINGNLATGIFIRVSAKTRSWERAERKALLIEYESDPWRTPGGLPTVRIPIEQAVRDFLADEQARKLAKTSTAQSVTLLQEQLLGWAATQSLQFLDELITPKLREFRASWGNGASTMQRKHHRLNGFFNFCIENDWLVRNPSKRMKPVKVSHRPTDYFLPLEFEQIVDATYAYGDWRGGRDFQHRRIRLRALVLLMRWSGLSILDAVMLERSKLQLDRLLLYRHKTGVPVYVPLPSDVADLLRSLPNSNPKYFFWSGNGDPHSAKKDWQRSLRRLFASVQLKTDDGQPKRCHPQMFRDTFAVELLLAGVPLDQVSLLLGHSSIKITEKHYAPFVKARQEQLEKSVRKTWTKLKSVEQKEPTLIM